MKTAAGYSVDIAFSPGTGPYNSAGRLFLGGHFSRIQWTGCLVVLMVITFMEYRKLIKKKHNMVYKRRTFLITLNVIKRVFLIFKEVGEENAADFACGG
ncbi:hypothetical protein [Bacillus atrophaeus]|uniref:hypothetical protein n=1 Tax=Bacillus atrophaeus TaxID=1452 RepID=UPI0007796B7B|nr:hypothetical protein [Bacillus atrophaeus]KYD05694.1 hypothetical protein B4144_0252 [Bacillus atrophaeus]